ncbi:MAG: hypothetical protein HYV04_09095 [Deltaproteobacteria bacterium]|nr:hypothetical protein [Deltaproteobacteria bacterium]
MRIFVTAIACVLTTFSYLPSVFADDCDAVLITTSIRTHSRDKLALATLKLVDQENYDQVKAGIGALGTIPIEGVPVDFGVSFDKFSEQRNKVYQKETLHFTRDTAHSLVMSYLDESIAKTWLDCKRVKSPGFHLAPLYRSETEIIIKAVWQPPQGLGTERLDFRGFHLSDPRSTQGTGLLNSPAFRLSCVHYVPCLSSFGNRSSWRVHKMGFGMALPSLRIPIYRIQGLGTCDRKKGSRLHQDAGASRCPCNIYWRRSLR